MQDNTARRRRRLPRPITMLVATILVSAAVVYLLLEARLRRELAAMQAVDALGGTMEVGYLPEVWLDEDCPQWLADCFPEWRLDVLSYLKGNDVNSILDSIREYSLATYSVDFNYLEDHPERIRDEHLRPVATMLYLRGLNLSGTQVSDSGLRNLEELTDLRELDLSGLRITDAGLRRLRGLTKLEFLDLSDTDVTDAGMASLQKLTRLSDLQLGGTQVTDAGLAHLKEMARMTRLELRETRTRGTGLGHLSGMKELSYLGLRETPLQRLGCDEYGNYSTRRA